MLEGEDYAWVEAEEGWYDLTAKGHLGWVATYTTGDEEIKEKADWIVMRAYGNLNGKTEFILKSEMNEQQLRDRLVMEWLLLRC